MASHLSDEELLDRADELMACHRVFFATSLTGGSAGKFFSSLFDSHSELFVFPVKLNGYVPVHQFPRSSKEENIERLLTRKDLFDSSLYGGEGVRHGMDSLGESKDQKVIIDKARFSFFFRKILDKHEYNMRNFSIAFNIAYHYAQNRFPTGNIFVFYIHFGIRAIEYQKHFGGGEVLAIVRHPINLRVSAYKIAKRRVIRGGVKKMTLSYTSAYPEIYHVISTILGAQDRLGLVSLEQLHNEPEESMRKVAKYMGIGFEDTLLQSTISGLLWWGKTETILNGFSSTLHQNVKASTVGDVECKRLGYILPRLFKHLGYEEGLKFDASLFEVLKIPTIDKYYYKDLIILLINVLFNRNSSQHKYSNYEKFFIFRNNLRNLRTVMTNHAVQPFKVRKQDAEIDLSRIDTINPFDKEKPYFKSV